DAWSCQILTGPASRAILAAVCDADLARPWLTHQETSIAGRACRLLRVSFAGELGWELHSRLEDTAAITAAVRAAGRPLGLTPFGMYALDALRLEKGYRAWRAEISPAYSVLEAGLERFVRWDKGDFPGREALLREKEQGPARRFV